MDSPSVPAFTASLVLTVAQAVQDPSGVAGLVEKGGFMAAFAVLMWWMLKSFDKKLDDLKNAIDRLADKVDK